MRQGRQHFVKRANLLNRPLRIRMVGGVGATVRSRCLPDQASLWSLPSKNQVSGKWRGFTLSFAILSAAASPR